MVCSTGASMGVELKSCGSLQHMSSLLLNLSAEARIELIELPSLSGTTERASHPVGSDHS